MLVWFQPQKLFIDDRVDEALPAQATPSASGTSGTTQPTTTAPASPRAVLTGSFISLDHGTSGNVQVLDTGGGTLVVRLEDLETDNGPDLFVYLSTNPADGAEGSFDDDYLNLGRLKGNIGSQNYDLPGGTDLERFRSVVIWCDRFNSAFGAADLTAA